MARATNGSSKGFTLIELTIVVMIIGILSTIGIPAFRKYQCRTKQGEAHSGLKTMYLAQESYRSRFDGYTDQITVLMPVLQGQQRYDFNLVAGSVTPDSWLGEATGKTANAQEGDHWSLNHANELQDVYSFDNGAGFCD